MDDEPLLFENDDAAARLKVKPRTLEKWRLEGKGPDFVKVGKRRFYTPEALRDFIAENTVRTKARG